MNEQRSAPRSRTYLFGRIVFGPDRAVCDCLVSDLSSGGARLYLVNAASMPNEFELHIPSRGQVCHVLLNWRQRYHVGVKFISVAARAIGSARRRWKLPIDERCKA